MDTTRAALRALKEALIPLAGGIAYGAIVAHTKQAPLDGVTAGGVAFFCLLAAQGLVLRATAATARDTQDQQPAPKIVNAPPPPLEIVKDPVPEPTPKPALKPVLELAPETVAKPTPKPVDDYVSIRLGIEELKEQGAWEEIGPETMDDGQKPLFRNLAYSTARKTPVEALAPRQLLDLKMPYQAVLNAAVNFEREIRRRADIPESRTLPLPDLFEHPQFKLSKEKLKQLDTLRRIRNSILHGFDTLVNPIEAAELVAAFDRAVAWFDPAKDEPEQKADAAAS